MFSVGEKAVMVGAVMLIFMLIFGIITAAKAECRKVCESNGHEEQYFVFSGGCWCQDEAGLYNPRDSREDR